MNEVSAELIEVVKVEFVRGKGSEEDPIRTVTSYYSKDGKLLAEKDPQHEGETE